MQTFVDFCLILRMMILYFYAFLFYSCQVWLFSHFWLLILFCYSVITVLLSELLMALLQGCGFDGSNIWIHYHYRSQGISRLSSESLGMGLRLSVFVLNFKVWVLGTTESWQQVWFLWPQHLWEVLMAFVSIEQVIEIYCITLLILEIIIKDKLELYQIFMLLSIGTKLWIIHILRVWLKNGYSNSNLQKSKKCHYVS